MRKSASCIGVGGILLYDVAGAQYPTSIQVRVVPRFCKESSVFSVLPWWGISTRQAAKMLGCKCSAARYLLHRNRVRFCRVKLECGGLRSYWDKGQVATLVKRRQVTPEDVSPESLIPLEKTLQRLGISRTTLERYVKLGLLKKFQLRRVSNTRGCQIGNYYHTVQVDRLAELRRCGLHLPYARHK